MFPEVAVLLIVISVVSCQVDGEFWWLKNDIAKFRHGKAPPPKFDDVNEFDTDETAKITFKDSDLSADSEIKPNLNTNAISISTDEAAGAIHFRDETELAKPLDKLVYDMNVNNKLWENMIQNVNNERHNTTYKDRDEFQFVFPSDANVLWTNTVNVQNEITTYPPENKMNTLSKINDIDKILPNNIRSEDKDSLNPESICSFIEKSECIRSEGTLHMPRLKSDAQLNVPNKQIICCILPIRKTSSSKIVFPDSYLVTKRFKRSPTDDMNSALKQRNTLMNRKYTPDMTKIKTSTPANRRKGTQKVVNSDEHSIDPYWNIKNSNIRNPDVPMYQDPDSGYDYGSESYGDDYAAELPKPGLIGLFSDHRQTQTSWNHNKNKGFSYDTVDSVEEEFETPFGYGSAIDPRLGHRSKSRPYRRRPSKLTATSLKYPMQGSPQSQTINFHSNPDFQILQGFKLLNLKRQKNRFVRKTPTNDADCDNNGLKIKEKPSKYINYAIDDYDEGLYENNLKQKLFNECGKPQLFVEDCENGHEQGVVQYGEHPWIVLVISTNSEKNVLCYGTLVHARVAISAAECVDGKTPGAISVIAGVRNLDRDVENTQRRMASAILDTEYTPGDLVHNLALLHWKRPLILDATVQPACLAEPHSGDSCLFVGWGGYDQKMLSDLRWQRASVLTQNCNKRLSKLKVDALCAAVESRGTVTGIGGPLLCKKNGRWSAVGVAMWRDDVVVLLPPYDWVIRHMANLRIQ